MSSIKAQVRKKTVPAMAWVSFGAAVLAGALAPGMWIGTVVREVLGISPWSWLPLVALLGVVTLMVRDFAIDGEPNKLAVYGAIAAPSMAVGAGGELSARIGELSSQILSACYGWLATWSGTTNATGLTMACLTVAVLLAQRTVKKSKKTAASAKATTEAAA